VSPRNELGRGTHVRERDFIEAGRDPQRIDIRRLVVFKAEVEGEVQVTARAGVVDAVEDAYVRPDRALADCHDGVRRRRRRHRRQGDDLPRGLHGCGGDVGHACLRQIASTCSGWSPHVSESAARTRSKNAVRSSPSAAFAALLTISTPDSTFGGNRRRGHHPDPVASQGGGSRPLAKESRRRRVRGKPRAPAPRREKYSGDGKNVSRLGNLFGGSFPGKLAPFQESWLLSRKAGSFPGKLAPFQESWLLSLEAGSFPWKLAPFQESWLLSRKAGSFRRKLAPFAGTWLLSLEPGFFRWNLAPFAGTRLLSLEPGFFRWNPASFAGTWLLSLEAGFLRWNLASSIGTRVLLLEAGFFRGKLPASKESPSGTGST
jgi:hypothetical protein